MDHSDAVRLKATERYLLNELDPEQLDQFEEHLFDCTDCALDVRAAAMLVEQVSVPALLELLVDQAHRDFQADWSVVLDLEDAATLVVVGEPPAPSWLRAFVSGGRASSSVATGECGPDDVGWAHLPAAELAVVLGRRSRAFRARERRRLVALAKIANHRWAELTGRQSRTLHPSAT